ncbi:hypothetical protein TEA_013928 [Camellia sinensis var. sinensis]|uniref:Uncharacterized protein n=1 Tax=Camellia sinensis var. sinensis TaxID=542762 RepID=A0A4S4EG84_CAMSN|nr:hypothetical protein TEA_013928 [Camellia sinensis var. sinensis]
MDEIQSHKPLKPIQTSRNGEGSVTNNDDGQPLSPLAHVFHEPGSNLYVIDSLIYLLRPKSTPISLSTRGAAIPSISANLAEHHLTKLPAHTTGSSAAGLQHLGCQSPCCVASQSAPPAKLNDDRARLHSSIAELGIAHSG